MSSMPELQTQDMEEDMGGDMGSMGDMEMGDMDMMKDMNMTMSYDEHPFMGNITIDMSDMDSKCSKVTLLVHTCKLLSCCQLWGKYLQNMSTYLLACIYEGNMLNLNAVNKKY